MVRGVVGTPKAAERMAKVPMIDQGRVPLELWRAKCIDTRNRAFVIADLKEERKKTEEALARMKELPDSGSKQSNRVPGWLF
jgi:hypothetical protein